MPSATATFRSCSAATARASRCRPSKRTSPGSTLAAVAAWVRDDLGLTLRVALMPVAAVRAAGLDIRIARFAASPDVSYAMFSGGGLAFAERG